MTGPRRLAKALMHRIAPRWTTALLSARARKHSQKVIAGWGSAAVTRKLVERFWSRVLRGTYTQIVDIGPRFGYYSTSCRNPSGDWPFRRSGPSRSGWLCLPKTAPAATAARQGS
jgi:hypothetical protein